MYPISDELKKLFLDGNKKCVKLTLNGVSFENDVITEADVLSDSLTVDRYCSSGNKIEVGSAIAAELTLTLVNNNEKFGDKIFEGADVALEIGIEGVTDSFIPCGKFTVDEPPRSSFHIMLKALDYMMRFDKRVDLTKLSFPMSVKALLDRICEICEVEISSDINLASLPNMDQTVMNAPASGDLTYRQILQWIAQITGTCAFMDWNGKLCLSWFTDAGMTLTPSLRYIGGNIDENDITISGVTVGTETKGSADYALIIEGNQLIYPGTEEALAENIYNAIKGLTYRPFACNCIPMPFLYPLDVVSYEELNGNIIQTVITNHNFGLNKASALSAIGETATKNNYSARRGITKQEIDAAISEALKGIDSKAEHIYIKYSPYDGGYDEDGKLVWSDKPTADTVYLGTCATNNATVPDTPSSYKWVKIRGVDGKTPVKDVDYFDGKDGGTLQVKYKNSASAPTVTNNDVSSWSDVVPAPEKGKRTYMVQKLSNETNWSTPIQISAEDGTSPTVSINSNGYWVIDGEATTVKAQGKDGNTPTITVGANGNWLVDGKDTNTKAQGAQGKDGADIEYVYYRSADAKSLSAPTYSSGKLSDGWTASPQGITETYKYEYVSVRTKPAGSTSWGAFSTPVIWSKWGEKGTDGDGVEYKYFLADVPGEYSYEAGDQTWTDEPTGVDEDWKYEYVVQIKHNGDGSTVISNPGTLWAKWGETGDKGRGVSKVETEYRLSTSDTSLSSGYTWGTDAPTWQDGLFLWTRLVTYYTDGTNTPSDPVVDASWKKTSVVEEASKELNETLANALGLHVTEYTVGSSKIRYYHSNSSLTNSKSGDTILVFNSNGFGVCKTGWNNGSPSFTYGTTFDGKAVWDILTANTINADLIKAGSIKSLPSAKVQTTINLDDGTISSTNGETSVKIQGGYIDKNGVTHPAGIALESETEDRHFIFTPSELSFTTIEYLLALLLHELNPSRNPKPEDPYFSSIAEKDIKTTNIYCKNIYIAGTDGNEYNLLDELTLMAEETNSLRESLSALQEKYTKLLESIGQTCDHSSTITKKENVVSPTCTEPGSYDNVVYCATCNAVLSRSTVTVDLTGHTDSTGDGYCDDCGAAMGSSGELTITEEVETLVNIPTQNAYVYLKFVPQYSGSYTFESLDQDSLDPDGQICDSNKVKIGDCYDGSSGGFCVTCDEFKAGTTYYLAARLFSGTGTLKVKVSYNAEVTTPTYAEDTIADGVLYIGTNTTSIDNTYQGNTEITKVIIPNNVTEFATDGSDTGGQCFRGCTNLTEVVVGSGITKITYACFYDCSRLAKVTIPTSVTTISEFAFGETALTDVYYKGTQEQWSSINIENNNTPLTNATIHYNS